MGYQLEVGARSVEDAIAAWRGGADRVELYVSPTEGALTPSAGLVKAVLAARKKLGFAMGLFAMLRPRAGDMLYSNDEFITMQHDLEILIEQGIDGLMFGILRTDGTLDLPRMKQLVQAAGDRVVTLHRAFDAVRDPFETLEQAVDLGVAYLLCGGLPQAGCWDRSLLPELHERAAGRIKLVIALGAAFKTPDLPDFLKNTSFQEFHIVNGYRQRPSMMCYRPDLKADEDDYLQQGSSFVEYLDENAVREIREIFKQYESDGE
jgi:copper homeostasis protein